MYAAGDDDQAIYAWAGADVNRFIKEPGKERVLKKSRRISKAVQEQSGRGKESGRRWKNFQKDSSKNIE